MKNFGQLLNEHVQRAGVSDAELARTIGVSRQTIFRWREGLTSRPRNRDDVLVIATKLRLTAAERDRLLLAAGFRPEEAAPVTPPVPKPAADSAPAVTTDTVALPEPATQPAPRPARRNPILTGAMVSLGAILMVAILGWWLSRDVPVEPAATPEPQWLAQATFPNDGLILITGFRNFTSDQGYNLASRLEVVLTEEIDAVGLQKVRVERWPEAINDPDVALKAGEQAGATLVIYGEYDAQRLLLEFAHPPDAALFADPALRQHSLSYDDLATVINDDLPRRVDALTWLALGQILIDTDQPEAARLLLLRTRATLQNARGISSQTRAVVNYYLGVAAHRSRPPYLDQAIDAYSQAIEYWPDLIAARLNRSAALVTRNHLDDLELALNDMNTVLSVAPEWGLAYNNRASIYLTRGGPANLQLALADVEQALAFESDLPEAYLNRAYLNFGLGQSVAEIVADVERAQELRPAYDQALNLLCWGYALENQAELALPHCNRAVEIAPDEPLYRDSRGLAYALMGDFAAAGADFEIYAAWLAAEKPGFDWERDLMRRRAWIEALAAGENPFTPEILKILRQEFGQ